MGSEQSPKDAPTPAATTPAATTKAAPKAEPKAQAQPAKSSEAKAEVRASLFCTGSALKPRITQQVQKYECFRVMLDTDFEDFRKILHVRKILPDRVVINGNVIGDNWGLYPPLPPVGTAPC